MVIVSLLQAAGRLPNPLAGLRDRYREIARAGALIRNTASDRSVHVSPRWNAA